MKNKLLSVVPNFQVIARSAAVERLKYLSGLEVLSEEIDQWESILFGSQMSLITIAGKDLRIFFKVHFRAASVIREFSSKKTRSQCTDFFNEYCNLWAGAIKQMLLERDIVCGISLPTALPGFDEVFFAKKLRPDRLHDCFGVRLGRANIVVTVAVDAGSDAVRTGLDSCSFAVNENDVEFL